MREVFTHELSTIGGGALTQPQVGGIVAAGVISRGIGYAGAAFWNGAIMNSGVLAEASGSASAGWVTPIVMSLAYHGEEAVYSGGLTSVAFGVLGGIADYRALHKPVTGSVVQS
jgi:hypothetical protein